MNRLSLRLLMGIKMRVLLMMLLFTNTCQATCLQNGDSVILTGVLVTKTYEGPEDISAPFTRWILQLNDPLRCVAEIDKSIPSWNTDVTVIPPKDGKYKNFKGMDNKKVNIKGRIILSSTVYNFTALLLFPEDNGVSLE